jgi:hypothetical protein
MQQFAPGQAHAFIICNDFKGEDWVHAFMRRSNQVPRDARYPGRAGTLSDLRLFATNRRGSPATTAR